MYTKHETTLEALRITTTALETAHAQLLATGLSGPAMDAMALDIKHGLDELRKYVTIAATWAPFKSHQWGAYYTGREEDGYKGVGSTEEAAFRDLIDNIEVAS